MGARWPHSGVGTHVVDADLLVRSHHMTVGQAGICGTDAFDRRYGRTLLASWLMSRPAAANPRYITNLLAWVTR